MSASVKSVDLPIYLDLQKKWRLLWVQGSEESSTVVPGNKHRDQNVGMKSKTTMGHKGRWQVPGLAGLQERFWGEVLMVGKTEPEVAVHATKT